LPIIREKESTLNRNHFLKLSVLGSSGTAAVGSDSESEAVLKAKGLSKTLSTWVIEDEKPVLASMKEASAVFKSYAQLADRQAEADELAANSKLLDQQRTEIQNNLNMLNQQIAQMPNPAAGVNSRMAKYYQQTPANNPLLAQRSQLNATLAEINQAQRVMKTQIPSAKDKSTLDAEVSKRKDAFKTTLTDLRKQIDDVNKKYADLAADESIKKAIETLAKSTHARVKLGPSDQFAAIAKEVDQAERKYLGKAVPAAATKKKAKAKK
jgi:chromosome segregation ATPase